MADAYKELVNWAGGIVSSMPPDQIPDEAIPQGINTAFLKVGGGKTGIGTRPGLKTVNTTALSGSPVLHWQRCRVEPLPMWKTAPISTPSASSSEAKPAPGACASQKAR